ncbi:tetratricopeptide repeat protein [Amycolatopsis albidoflavus]
MLMAPPLLFVDREPEREDVLRRVAATRASGGRGVFVFTGLPGVGKSTLALWCAHALKDAFKPALYVGMGASSQALTVEDALTIILPYLGVGSLPSSREGKLAAYRAATAVRPVLLMVDDVESAGHLNDLLPTSAGSVVLATSRRRSEGFEQHGFTTVPVQPFSVESAKELLAYDPDVAAQDEHLGVVAELCGRLPLALGVARAQLRTHHDGQIAAYVARLRVAKSVLAEFTIDGDRVVEHIYEVSYQDLTEAGQLLYRLLSVHPGSRFGTGAAAALLGDEHGAAVVRSLVTASLLTDVGGGRYELHTLVRRHAAGLAGETDHPADLRAALRRVVEWYLEFAVAREQVLSDRVRFGELFDGRIAPAYSGDRAADRAIADLELERPNLRRAVRAAADEGFDDLAWQLCEALVTFYFQRELYADAIATYRVGLQAAERVRDDTGDARPLLRMHTELGTAYFSAYDHDSAQRHYDQAARLAAELGDDVTSAKMHVWKALVQRRLGDPAAALETLGRSRALVRDPSFPAALRAREDALLDMNGGPILAEAGRFEEAVAAGRRAVDFFACNKDRFNHAKSVANLGESLALAGDSSRAEAIEVLGRALELEQELSLPGWEAHTRQVLGTVLLESGETAEGRRMLRRAAELFEELNDRRAEALRARLDD